MTVATTRNIWATNQSFVVKVVIVQAMFRAIGVLLILWYLSSLFSQSFLALDSALTASFQAVESAAVQSQKQFEK